MSKTLIVMAAGMGSRFGGLKQIEAVGANGEFILDYSVYDAKRAGFQRVVFVIKEELESIFRETVGKRLEGKIEVCYAYQRLDDIPRGDLASKRSKPWGTAQAVLCAKDYVDGDFCVVNADDFYGYNSYLKAIEFMDNNKDENIYASINFPYYITSSKIGSVKRAVCTIDGDDVIDLRECKITTMGDYALAEPLNGDEEFKISLDTPVAVNMFVFKNSFFEELEKYVNDYFLQSDEDILNNEILLPELIKELIRSKKKKLKNIVSQGKWMGMTYKEEKELIKNNLIELIKMREYPENLWD